MAAGSRLCSSIKADGGRCKREAMPGSEYCYSHDPSLAQRRKSNASKGGKRGGRGRAGVSGELSEIKAELQRIAKVAPGSEETKGYSVAVQALNVVLRALAEEREQKHQGELIERIEALEKGGGGDVSKHPAARA